MERRPSWIAAARVPAQALIAAPLFFGQSLALISCAHFSWTLFLWAHGIGLLVHVLIVFGRSASAGPRRDAPPIRAQIAITFAALLALAAVGAHLAYELDRPFMIAMLMLPSMLLWADSFPPLALHKRGLGHWLHGVGVGLVLPIVGFYLQCGELVTLLPAALIASLGVAIGGGLALEPPRTSRQSLALVLIAAAALATPLLIASAPPSSLVVFAAIPLALAAIAVRSRADSSRFAWLASAAVTAVQLGWAACAWAARLPRA